jgi:hypothetical protein
MPKIFFDVGIENFYTFLRRSYHSTNAPHSPPFSVTLKKKGTSGRNLDSIKEIVTLSENKPDSKNS